MNVVITETAPDGTKSVSVYCQEHSGRALGLAVACWVDCRKTWRPHWDGILEIAQATAIKYDPDAKPFEDIKKWVSLTDEL